MNAFKVNPPLTGVETYPINALTMSITVIHMLRLHSKGMALRYIMYSDLVLDIIRL